MEARMVQKQIDLFDAMMKKILPTKLLSQYRKGIGNTGRISYMISLFCNGSKYA
jgi:hypothetical protein